MTKIQELIKTANDVPSLKSLKTKSRTVERLNTRLLKIFNMTKKAVRQADQVGEVGSTTAKLKALKRIEKLSLPLKKIKTEIDSSELNEEKVLPSLNQISSDLDKTILDLDESWERSLQGIETKYQPLVGIAQTASLDKNGEFARSLAIISQAKSNTPLSDENMNQLLSTLTKIVWQSESLNLSDEINKFLREVQNEGATLSSLSNNEVRDFLNQHKDFKDGLRIKQLNG